MNRGVVWWVTQSVWNLLGRRRRRRRGSLLGCSNLSLRREPPGHQPGRPHTHTRHQEQPAAVQLPGIDGQSHTP